MITVYLPAPLRPYAGGAEVLTITAPVNTMAELLAALERTAPHVMRQVGDSFMFAVNGDVLPRASDQLLKPGDRVEIVPASRS